MCKIKIINDKRKKTIINLAKGYNPNLQNLKHMHRYIYLSTAEATIPHSFRYAIFSPTKTIK